MTEILETLAETRRVVTGERYMSDLTDCDKAFGNHLVNLLDGLREFSSKGASEPFYRYTQRKKGEKLYHAPHSDPKAFLKEWRQRNPAKPGERPNKGALPQVAFKRLPSLGFAPAGDEVLVKDKAQLVTEEGQSLYAYVDSMPVTVSYQVMLLAWDQVTLGKLSAGLLAALATSPRDRSYRTLLVNAEVETHLHLGAAQDLIWDEIGPGASGEEDDRLLALTLNLECNTNVLQARCVTEMEVTINIMMPAPHYSEFSND